MATDFPIPLGPARYIPHSRTCRLLSYFAGLGRECEEALATKYCPEVALLWGILLDQAELRSVDEMGAVRKYSPVVPERAAP
jgi:hypothetical protein